MYSIGELRSLGVQTNLDDVAFAQLNTLVTDRIREYAGEEFNADAAVSRRVQLGLVRLYLMHDGIRETDVGDARISYRSVRIEESRLLRRLTGPAWKA